MAAETLIQAPRTMMEVFNCLPEGTLVQLIENNLIMSPAPLDRHQVLTGEIYADLLFFIRSAKIGVARIAPYDVYLDKNNAFQPDICFIATAHTDRIKANGLHGAPDLVVEVLSPSTARYDLGEKKDVYERCGVTEYWVIDPADESATGYYLVNGKYVEFFQGQGTLESKLLGCSIKF
jgi:Uma2 family endonuclease